MCAVPERDQSRGSTFQSMGTIPLPAAVCRTTCEGERVGHGVVADRVPLGEDPPGQVGMRVGLPADEGERGLDAVPGEQGEYLWGPVRVGPVVDGERDRGRDRGG